MSVLRLLSLWFLFLALHMPHIDREMKRIITCHSLPLIFKSLWYISVLCSSHLHAVLSIAQPCVKELIQPSAAVSAAAHQETQAPNS